MAIAAITSNHLHAKAWSCREHNSHRICLVISLHPNYPCPMELPVGFFTAPAVQSVILFSAGWCPLSASAGAVGIVICSSQRTAKQGAKSASAVNKVDICVLFCTSKSCMYSQSVVS